MGLSAAGGELGSFLGRVFCVISKMPSTPSHSVIPCGMCTPFHTSRCWFPGTASTRSCVSPQANGDLGLLGGHRDTFGAHSPSRAGGAAVGRRGCLSESALSAVCFPPPAPSRRAPASEPRPTATFRLFQRPFPAAGSAAVPWPGLKGAPTMSLCARLLRRAGIRHRRDTGPNPPCWGLRVWGAARGAAPNSASPKCGVPGKGMVPNSPSDVPQNSASLG